MERRAEHPPDPIGESSRRFGIETAGDDEELVARDPPHDVVAAHAVADPLGGEDEQLVADGVTHRVVDELELVEIEEHQSDGPTCSPRLTEHRVDVLDDQYAVGEASEVVVIRLVGQPEAERGLLLHRARQAHDRGDREDETQHGRDRSGGRHVVEGDDHDRGEQRSRDRDQPAATHRVDRPACGPSEEPDRRVQHGRSHRRRHEQVRHLEQRSLTTIRPASPSAKTTSPTSRHAVPTSSSEMPATATPTKREAGREHDETHRDRGVDATAIRAIIHASSRSSVGKINSS